LGLVQFILLDVTSTTRDLLGYFSAIEHMGTFSRGIIDTRPIVLYVSMTIVMLTLTYQAFQSPKWRRKEMPDKKKNPRTRGKIGRIRIGLNVLVQIALILFLVAMANSLAFKHYARWDFSRDQKYTLSDKTKRFLDTLKGKMRITVFFSPNTPISGDVL